jgi:hypothetical protein
VFSNTFNRQYKQSSPAKSHGGAWGERRYSSYSFSTSARDGGEWSASRPGSRFAPGKGHPVPIVQKAGRASEPVWTQEVRIKIIWPCRGSNPDRPVVQSVIRHYTDWASPAPTNRHYIVLIWTDTNQAEQKHYGTLEYSPLQIGWKAQLWM